MSIMKWKKNRVQITYTQILVQVHSGRSHVSRRPTARREMVRLLIYGGLLLITIDIF